MQARCPYCAHIFAAERGGVQPCPQCGQQINIPLPASTGVPPSAPAPEGAMCALHPVQSASGTCARCGNFTCDECSAGRTQSLCPTCRAQTGATGLREPTPWERRAELGLFQAFWQTWKKVLIEPEKFWASMRTDTSWVEAMLYGWLVTGIASVLQFPMNIWNFGNMEDQLRQASGRGGDLPPEVMRVFDWIGEHASTSAVGLLVFGVVFYPLSFIVSSALIHLGCLIFGASKNGFNATARVVGYASGPVALSWIPLVGGLAGLYVLVLQIWGIYKAQETTVPRAILAVLGLILLLMCCACGVGIFAAVTAASAMAR